jgi:exodeoxyribonuclease (lambda-induced)
MNTTAEIFNRIEHFKIEQRSPEWFQIRLGKFTSSNIYKLFASATKEKRAAAALKSFENSNYKITATAQEINFACKKLQFTEEETKQAKKDCKEAKQRLTELSEKVLKFCNCLDNIHTFSEGAETFILEKAAEFIFSDKDSIFVNDAMMWGIENEEEAKKQYLKKTGFMGLDVGFIEAGNNTGSSPDLLVSVASENIGLAEFKCPNQLNHLKNVINIKTSEDLKKHHLNYWFQCQHQIYCSGRTWCDFVSFHPNLLNGPYAGLSLHIVRIPKDEKIQAQFAEILPKAAALRDNYIKELLNKI